MKLFKKNEKTGKAPSTSPRGTFHFVYDCFCSRCAHSWVADDLPVGCPKCGAGRPFFEERKVDD